MKSVDKTTPLDLPPRVEARGNVCKISRIRKRHVFIFTVVATLSYFLVVCYQQRSVKQLQLTKVCRIAKNNSVETRCFQQLNCNMSFFSKELNSSNSYIRLRQPMPITGDCKEFFADWVSPSAAPNITAHKHFKRDDQLRIESIANQLAAAFSERNLEIFMCGGSLLGSVRHFGFFPWDADLDFMVLWRQKPQLRELLVDISASDELMFVDSERFGHWQLGLLCQVERDKPMMKMYGRDRLYYQKKCPTIADFFFGRVEGTYYNRFRSFSMSFPLSDVYPLSLRPFGSHLLPAPREPAKFLNAVYGEKYETRCNMKYFRHLDFDCKSLHFDYPFAAHLKSLHNGRNVHLDVLVLRGNIVAFFVY